MDTMVQTNHTNIKAQMDKARKAISDRAAAEKAAPAIAKRQLRQWVLSRYTSYTNTRKISTYPAIYRILLVYRLGAIDNHTLYDLLDRCPDYPDNMPKCDKMVAKWLVANGFNPDKF